MCHLIHFINIGFACTFCILAISTSIGVCFAAFVSFQKRNRLANVLHFWHPNEKTRNTLQFKLKDIDHWFCGNNVYIVIETYSRCIPYVIWLGVILREKCTLYTYAKTQKCIQSILLYLCKLCAHFYKKLHSIYYLLNFTSRYWFRRELVYNRVDVCVCVWERERVSERVLFLKQTCSQSLSSRFTLL